MTTLRFEIDTDASYDADELEELQNVFTDWFQVVDADADADTADVRIVDASSDDDKKQGIIDDFLKNTTISVSVSLDGEELLQGSVG